MGSISAMYLEVPRLKSLPANRLTLQGFHQILIPYRQVLQIRLRMFLPWLFQFTMIIMFPPLPKHL